MCGIVAFITRDPTRGTNIIWLRRLYSNVKIISNVSMGVIYLVVDMWIA